MSERDPSVPEPNFPALDERGFNANVEKFLQHSPGVQHCLDILEEAQGLDKNLIGTSGTHPLSRRFTINSGGSEFYPFPHTRVEMQPKHSNLPQVVGIKAVMLRFALAPKDEHEMVFGGAITVTYALETGVVADFVLTDTSYEPFVDSKDLNINQAGVLSGVAKPRGDSKFNSQELDFILSNMEPILQNNSVSS